jgi:hypothetical protein
LHKEGCTSLGCETQTAAPKTSFAKENIKMNYPVPNFGVDKDIVATEKHLKDMEAKLGKWDMKPKTKGPEFKMNYKVNDFGVDHDISDSLSSLATTEKQLNKKWVVEQTATQQAADIHVEKEVKKASDPTHGSGDGCVEYDFNGKPGKKCGAGPYTHDSNGVPIAQA